VRSPEEFLAAALQVFILTIALAALTINGCR
jgi:hypothetical protein